MRQPQIVTLGWKVIGPLIKKGDGKKKESRKEVPLSRMYVSKPAAEQVLDLARKAHPDTYHDIYLKEVIGTDGTSA